MQLRDALRAASSRGGARARDHDDIHGRDAAQGRRRAVRLGAEVRVAFDARTTKLHAKAWLLERGSGLTTAFVGSSNLSHTALFDGLEWNVRLSAVDAPHVIERVRDDVRVALGVGALRALRPGRDGDKLDRALGSHADRESGPRSPSSGLDVRPYPHQERILDRLTVERERHDRHRNLVVAATGTGKTVVAALDYDALCQRHGRRLSLLFVAHRDQILEQALATFRHVVHDGVLRRDPRRRQDRRRPARLRDDPVAERGATRAARSGDVRRRDRRRVPPRGCADYRRLLDHLEPMELVGLTATPERMDEQDVTAWFGGRIAFEMRLWEAIDEGFLVPFQYFGVADGTDSRPRVAPWRLRAAAARRRHHRQRRPRRASCWRRSQRVLIDPGAMRALGFCVSVDHAHFMARAFNERGLAAVAIDGTTRRRRARGCAAPPGGRRAALRVLRRRPRRGRRRAGRRHRASASSDGQRDRLHAAARARTAPRTGKAT